MPMRGLIGFLAFACLSLGIAFPVHAQGTAPSDTEVSPPGQTVAVAPVARDEQIDQRITRILTATGWYRRLQVSATDGVVFLDGDTDRTEHRTWARDLAAKTQDVVAVVNRIAVSTVMDWSFGPARTQIAELIREAIAALPLIAVALIIIPLAGYAASVVARSADWLLSNRLASPFLRRVLARTLAIPVFLIGLYIVLQIAGLTQLAVSILGGAGVFGIIVGFAFRDIAENFLASLLLSIRQPFRRGDSIKVGEHEGIVQSMDTRSTLLLSIEGNHIQIPNATIFKSTIINFSTAPARREVLEVGIGYDDAIAAAQQIILDVLEGHAAVLRDPDEPLVLVDSLGTSTVNLRAYFWFDGHAHSVLRVRSALLRLIKQALEANGISMPDEAREIIFPKGVPLVRGMAPTGSATVDAVSVDRSEPGRSEPGPTATEAEGDLISEKPALDRQGATAKAPNPADDLLDRPA